MKREFRLGDLVTSKSSWEPSWAHPDGIEKNEVMTVVGFEPITCSYFKRAGRHYTHCLIQSGLVAIFHPDNITLYLRDEDD